MSRSPLTPEEAARPDAYLRTFQQLAEKIREGQSFSGRERNVCFLNTGKGRKFADSSFATGLDYPDDGRGMALTDWDGDGRLDVWLSNRTAPRLRLLRNGTSGGHWLAVRLIGDPARNVPLDPAGARLGVEIDLDGSPLTLWRTLLLGDGFLSQSGQTLHFGLGPATQIRRLLVQWPGSPKVLQLPGVPIDGRYRLKMGAGAAEPWPVTPSPPLKDGPPALPDNESVARIRLSQPLKLSPDARWTDEKGTSVSVRSRSETSPLLISLWAPDCTASHRDLTALQSMADRLKSTGLQLVALSTEESATPPVDGFSLPSGRAPRALIDALDDLRRDAVYKVPPLPLPSHFLVQPGGFLAAIYLAALPSEATLLADLDSLKGGPDAALAGAVPMPGQWVGKRQFVTHPIAVAQAFADIARPAEGIAYLEKFTSEHPEATADENTRKQLSNVQFRLGEFRKATPASRSQAIAHFRKAASLNPSWPVPRLALADALAQTGDPAQALAVLGPLRQNPATFGDAAVLTGEIERDRGRWTEALAAWRAVVTENPRFIPALIQLSLALSTAPDSASVRNGAEALKIAEFFMQAPGAAANPQMLAALAAAQAETGQWEAAVATEDRILALARAKNDQPLADLHRQRRDRFSARQPLRQ